MSRGGNQARVVRKFLCAGRVGASKRKGQEVAPPEFEVLSREVTAQRLSRELPPLFPDLEIVVDNDIDA